MKTYSAGLGGHRYLCIRELLKESYFEASIFLYCVIASYVLIRMFKG